jgi:uncharacterized protein
MVTMFLYRNISEEIFEALSSSPIVLLNGARQTGKSTLVKWIAEQRQFEYVTLDDLTTLNAVIRDPVGYLAAFKKPLIIDEVQRAPGLFLTLKQLVDQQRTPGKYLLTGSANVFVLPRLSESLAGRIEIITLWPFSCDELASRKGIFIDRLFSRQFDMNQDENFSREEFITKMMNGGYPEVQTLSTQRRKNAWFQSYITTILQRDVQDISRIEGIHELPRLLNLIAAQSGSLVNFSSLSRDAGLVMMTLKRYVALLEATFLIKRLPAWFKNIGKRLIKAPKIYLNDTGLTGYLLGIDQQRFVRDPHLLGRLLENYVMHEMFKQSGWSRIQPQIYYYRSTAGKEVDFLLENRAGEIVGIEVKAASTVTQGDFSGIMELKASLGEHFIRGIVLYLGQRTVPFGNNLSAVPVSDLWLKSESQ